MKSRHLNSQRTHIFRLDLATYLDTMQGTMDIFVFGDDMFTRFENEDPIDVGRDYRKFILEPGGSKDAETQIIDFLGREPNNQAFIEEIGLDSNSV
ncbi:MAG TPA: hypothetical protein EYQ00_02040 [Dehalococcoidia bacterium]|nr:hypothetical protein [Dehalococcoidia bacterium]